MESAIKMPIDLLQLPPFRQLRVALGSPERALFIWFTLWQELGYLAQEGSTSGRLPAAHVPVVLNAFEPVERDPEKCRAILAELIASRLLRQDGEDYVCPRFAVMHGDMTRQRSQAQRGGDMRAFKLRMNRAEGQAFQQSLLIDEGMLVDGEGQPLPPETVKRVTRLIVACDNALFHEVRSQFGYTEGLIQSALMVLNRFTDEEIDSVCRTVALRRHHPALNGLTAEKLLPRFADIAQKLGGGA
jgi:hypothetical protein